jgi:hypothetical protein
MGNFFSWELSVRDKRWATANKVTDNFWTNDLNLSTSERGFFERKVKEGDKPDNKLY